MVDTLKDQNKPSMDYFMLLDSASKKNHTNRRENPTQVSIAYFSLLDCLRERILSQPEKRIALLCEYRRKQSEMHFALASLCQEREEQMYHERMGVYFETRANRLSSVYSRRFSDN